MRRPVSRARVGAARWKGGGFFVIALLLSSSLVAIGAAAPAAAPTAGRASAYELGKNSNGADALQAVVATIEAKLKEMQNSPALKDIGFTLVAFFVLANAVFYLLKGFVSGGGFSSVAGEFLVLAITLGVTQIFMDMNVGGVIQDSLDVVAGAITGLGAKASSSIGQLMNDAAVDTFTTIHDMWNVGGMLGRGAFQILEDVVLGELQLVFFAFLLKVAAILLATLFIVTALCLYFAILVTSQVTISIALILAPIFVPFLLFPRASFMFDGWLRFTIGAGLMKVVGLVMAEITGAFMSSLAGLSTQLRAQDAPPLSLNIATNLTDIGNSFSVDIFMYFTMVLLAILSLYLMAQVPTIATGLVSGSGVGGGFGGLRLIALYSMPGRALSRNMSPRTGAGARPRQGSGTGGGSGAGTGQSQAGGGTQQRSSAPAGSRR